MKALGRRRAAERGVPARLRPHPRLRRHDRQVHRRLGDGVLRRAGARSRPPAPGGARRDRDRGGARGARACASGSDAIRVEIGIGIHTGIVVVGHDRLRPPQRLHRGRRRRERGPSAREARAPLADPGVRGGAAPRARRGAACASRASASSPAASSRCTSTRWSSSEAGRRPRGSGLRCRRRAASRAARAAGCWPASLLAGCTTPLELGERRYREGDRSGRSRSGAASARTRPTTRGCGAGIDAVEEEFQQLVVRYKKRAIYFERQGRLAESILNYRLALQLEPDDRTTLDARAGAGAHPRRQQARREARAAARTSTPDGSPPRATTSSRCAPSTPSTRSSRRRRARWTTRCAARWTSCSRAGGAASRRATTGARAPRSRRCSTLDAQNESARGYLAYIDAIRATTAEHAGDARLPRAETHAGARLRRRDPRRGLPPECAGGRALGRPLRGDPQRAARARARARPTPARAATWRSCARASSPRCRALIATGPASTTSRRSCTARSTPGGARC